MSLPDNIISAGIVASYRNPTTDEILSGIGAVMSSSLNDDDKWNALEYLEIVAINRDEGITREIILALADAASEILGDEEYIEIPENFGVCR